MYAYTGTYLHVRTCGSSACVFVEMCFRSRACVCMSIALRMFDSSFLNIGLCSESVCVCTHACAVQVHIRACTCTCKLAYQCLCEHACAYPHVHINVKVATPAESRHLSPVSCLLLFFCLFFLRKFRCICICTKNPSRIEPTL